MAVLRRSVDSQSSLRAAAEARAAEEHRQRVDLAHRVGELEEAAAEQALIAGARDADLEQLRKELERSNADRLALAEEKARLEVCVVVRWCGGKTCEVG